MFSWRKFVIPLGIVVMFGSLAFAAEPKVWHVTATKDQTFIVEGEKNPVQCMVPCGPAHAEQKMKLVVEP